MPIHFEVLPAKQRRVLARLGPAATALGFHLGGGTALALHLGHRRSVDFDWFTGRRLRDPHGLARRLRERGIPLATTHVAEGTLHGTIGGVQVSFFEYAHRRLRPFVGAGDFDLASLDDLACMKLAAIVDRGSKKDFVDVWALGSRHRPLAELLRLYARRYRAADPGHVLVALGYFDDAERTRMPRMIWQSDWRAVRRQIEAWVVETMGGRRA
jgi:hypothetical protein